MKTFGNFIAEMGDPTATNKMYAVNVHKQLQDMWTWMGENGLLDDPEYSRLVSVLEQAKKEAEEISARAQMHDRF